MNCKSCGAAATADTSTYSFVCGYCGTKNVDEQYFKDYAAKVDAGKANRMLRMGLNAFNSGDYVQAEKHLEASVLEDDQNPEGWIYLALCKTATVKASHFNKNFDAAKDCLSRASQINPSSEIVQFGILTVGNKFLEASVRSAKYYFETADKKYFAFGENKDAAIAASGEAQNGFAVIRAAFELKPTDAPLVASVSCFAITECFSLEDIKAPKSELEPQKEYFLDRLLEVYDVRPDVVSEESARFSKWQERITRLIQQKRARVPTAPRAIEVERLADKPNAQTNVPQTSNQSPQPRPTAGSAGANSSEESTAEAGSKRKLIAVLVTTVVIVSGAAGFWMYQDNLRKVEEQARIAKQEEERKRQVEAEQKAKAEAETRALADARAKAEAEERARQETEERMRQLEARSAQLAQQQEEVVRRQQQEEITRRQQQAEFQKRQLQAQQQKAPPVSVSPSSTGAVPAQQLPGKVAALDPRERCASKDNFISKGLCESKACQKPEYKGHPYCERYQQKSDPAKY